MAFKFIAAFALLAVVAAEAPLHSYQPSHLVNHVEHEAPAEYKFEYSVHDEHTGDIKEQQESRHGDNVEGHYSLVEPDGHRRIVHYTADEHNGFNAKVEREYIGQHISQQVVAKNVYAAPAIQQVAYKAPVVHHSAPAVHHVSYKAPAVHHDHASTHYTHVEPNVHQASHYSPAQYDHHGDAQSTVSVQSHGVNYHY